MKRLFTYTLLILIIIHLNATPVQPGVFMDFQTANNGIFEHLCTILRDVGSSDLTFCLGYIKKSAHSNHDIAKFIFTWSPDAYTKQIPSIFRSKIDRVITKLASVDYEQLIIDIDFIKNSQLTVSDMVRLIDGTGLGKKK